MADIIASVPYECGDSDCKVQWHLTNYWIQDDGTFTSVDRGDDDHTEIEESDLPTAQEEEQAWIEYFQYVAATGLDPIDEFILPTSHKKPHKWQARIRNLQVRLKSDRCPPTWSGSVATSG